MSSSVKIQRSQHGTNKSPKVVSMCKEIRQLQIRNEQYTTHYQNLLDHLKFELSRGRHLDQLAASRPKPQAQKPSKQRVMYDNINRIHKYCSGLCKDRYPASSLKACPRCKKTTQEVYCNSAWILCANCSCKEHICVFCAKEANMAFSARAPAMLPTPRPIPKSTPKSTPTTIAKPKPIPIPIPIQTPVSSTSTTLDQDRDRDRDKNQDRDQNQNQDQDQDDNGESATQPEKKSPEVTKSKPASSTQDSDSDSASLKTTPPKPKKNPPRARKTPKKRPPAPKEEVKDILARCGRWFRPWSRKQHEAARPPADDGDKKGQPANKEADPSSAVVDTTAPDKKVDSALQDRIQALEALQASVRKAMATQFVAEYKTYPHTGLYSNSVLWRQNHLVDHGIEEFEQEEDRRREEDNLRDRKMHHDFLKAVVSHAKVYREYHKNKRTAATKLCKLIKAHIDGKERDAAREQAKKEQARLEALKNNDMEAYQQLIKQYKDERVEFLLNQTSKYLENLSQLVQTQKTEISKDKIELIVGEEEDEEKATHSGAQYHLMAHATREKVRCQPNMLTGGTLKDYQMVGLEWLVSLYNNSLNGILADEMGLGKTIQTIALLTYLMEIKQNNGPFLIVVPLSTLTNWDNELIKWAPKIRRVVYKGNREMRKEIRTRELAARQFNCLLTTYDYVIKDKAWLKKLYWEYIVVDEGHRMKNSRCKFSLILGHEYRSRHRLLLTGTPLQNNLSEMWSLLNFLLPKVFDSINNFEQWFSAPFRHFRNTGGGSTTPAAGELSEEERLIIINRLHSVLRPFLLRRQKVDVLDQLPEKVEKVIKCELSAWQKLEYEKISRFGMASVRPGRRRNSRVANALMQLRKICNHPYLFQDHDEWEFDDNLIRSSGKVEILDNILPKLRARGHRVLIFSQMTKLLTILENFLLFKNYQYVRLDGQVSQEKREQAMYQFNAPDSPHFVFLLSTRAGGLGVNLATADTVIIFDSDWNPQMDLQAQARAHRIGQMREVRVFRLISRTNMEEKMLACTNDKLDLEKLVIEIGLFKKGKGKGSSAEKDKAIRDILAGADRSKDGEHGGQAHTSAEINEMLARDEDELAEFNLIDERDAVTIEKDWAERRKSNPKLPEKYSRLMTIEEVPDYVRQPAENPMDKATSLIELGPRKRKFVDYTLDRISDREYFDRKLGQNDDDEPRRKRKPAASKDADEPTQRSGRKRKLKGETASGQPKPKKTPNKAGKSKARKAAKSSSAKGAKASKAEKVQNDKAANENPAKRLDFKRMTEVLNKVKMSENENSALHCIQFLELPSKQLYPDYWQIIKQPISFTEIEGRIETQEYVTTKDFVEDFKLMIRNAKEFNRNGSAVYVSAEAMDNIFDAELKRIF